MSSVRLALRADLSRLWRSMLGLALLLGLIGGVVLAAAAGARRTDTAYPRLLAWASAADHAERAFALEFATGRSLWSRPSQTWHTLHQAIQAAARAQRPVVAFSRSY